MNPRPLALVTGASAGIGATFARRLAPTHDLILVARRLDRLRELSQELAAQGARVTPLVADLATDAGIAAVAERIAAEPSLTLLVNNAGFGTSGVFWETDLARQDEMHRLHILATLHLCRAALAAFVPRGRGAIVNVASVAAFVRGAGSAGYGATKTWMTAFTEGLHLELRQRKSAVTVQALCPGFTYSDFHDTMGSDRSKRAPKAFWLSADHVVRDSLRGVRSGRLFVVPGWRYRLIVALSTKLPASWRVALEGSRGEK